MFQVVRNDLACVVADAIVIPANPSATIGGTNYKVDGSTLTKK